MYSDINTESCFVLFVYFMQKNELKLPANDLRHRRHSRKPKPKPVSVGSWMLVLMIDVLLFVYQWTHRCCVLIINRFDDKFKEKMRGMYGAACVCVCVRLLFNFLVILM